MEISFYSNKCALKDAIRIIKRAKNPCWKRRNQLISYSKELISANSSILSLYPEIEEYEQEEFEKLVSSFESISSVTVKEEALCAVCQKNCLEEALSVFENAAEESGTPFRTPDALQASLETRTEHLEEIEKKQESQKRIAQVGDKMGRLNTAANFIESLISLQGEGVSRASYEEAFSAAQTESTFFELEEILARKRRNLTIRRWVSAFFVFLFFLSILFFRPLFPSL